MSALIEFKDITLRKDTGETLLDAASARVDPGERIAVVGESGAGKSLLLRSVALIEEWREGGLWWRGKPIDDSEVPAYRSRIIYLHQRPSFAEGTVEHNLRQALSLKIHRGKIYQREKLAEYLREAGWPESFFEKETRRLSGGEAQVAAFLRAIQLDPDMLLLDEPTAALDAQRTAVVENVIGRWQQSHPTKAYLWVTHSAEQSKRIADRVWRVEKGKLFV